jgi:hypothetical protein
VVVEEGPEDRVGETAGKPNERASAQKDVAQGIRSSLDELVMLISDLLRQVDGLALELVHQTLIDVSPVLERDLDTGPSDYRRTSRKDTYQIFRSNEGTRKGQHDQGRKGKAN